MLANKPVTNNSGPDINGRSMLKVSFANSSRIDVRSDMLIMKFKYTVPYESCRPRAGRSGGRVIALTGSGKDKVVYDVEFDGQ
jgi:hypothetical protein